MCIRDRNSDLRIAIKADANTPYSVIKNVMNSLQDLRENLSLIHIYFLNSSVLNR